MQVETVLQLGLPLIILNDFNYILDESYKQGGTPFWVNRDIRKFKGFNRRSGFIDLGFTGSKYTWCNSRAGQARVWKWIDRVFASKSWFNMYLEATILYISWFVSDHYLLLLILKGNLSWKKPSIRFEKLWLYCKGIKEVSN